MIMNDKTTQSQTWQVIYQRRWITSGRRDMTEKDAKSCQAICYNVPESVQLPQVQEVSPRREQHMHSRRLLSQMTSLRHQHTAEVRNQHSHNSRPTHDVLTSNEYPSGSGVASNIPALCKVV